MWLLQNGDSCRTSLKKGAAAPFPWTNPWRQTVIGSSISSTNPMLARLQAQGLSSDKASLVASDMEAAVKEVTGKGGGGKDGASAGAAPDKLTVRAALDKRIASDVAAGKLSESDAAEVKKALDEVDGKPQAAAGDDGEPASEAPGKAGGGPRGGGGGGAGASAQKTERSRTVTVAGAIKTTTITYTDGTSETTTGSASTADEAKYGKQGPADAQTSTVADYLSTIEPGSLFDQAA
jgi:hypothetical protein